MSQYKNRSWSLHDTAVSHDYSHEHYPRQIDCQRIADAMQDYGYSHVDPIYKLQPGAKVRISTRGKSSSNDAVIVSMFADGQGAYFQDFVTGECGPIWPTVKRSNKQVEADRQLKQMESKRRIRETEKQALQDQAARQAQHRWQASATEFTHNYIADKQLSSQHNARKDSASSALLIPMWMPDAGLVNLQRIYPNGSKRFLKGARVKGTSSVIGSLHSAKRVLVCEGWATGASLSELYGLPVVVAFNAGNLMDVCQVVRSRFADIEIIVAGDDDRQTQGNPGRTKAIEAAEAIGAKLAFPELCKCCTCTDHNDATICARRCGRG